MAANGSKRTWAISALLAVLLVAGLIALFRAPESGLARNGGGGKRPPAVQLARPTEADAVLKAEAVMRDLRPLFLPTEFNVALAEPRREPGRSILDDERPAWSFVENEPGLGLVLPPVAALNGKPANQARPTDTLSSVLPGVGLIGYGRAEPVVGAMTPRGGFLEVVAVSTGRRVLAESLPVALGPPGGRPWEPLELFASVDAAGLAVPLVVTDGSRVEEVDAHFKKTLAQVYRIGERLSPGFYRIVVGP